MKQALAALVLGLLCATLGWVFQQDPYQVRAIGSPNDQVVLAHRDSPYTHITWVVSEDNNSAQLRFYDKVEGGICLHPSWREMSGLIGDYPYLASLYGDFQEADGIADPSWPADKPLPNPGGMTENAYISLFPTGVLLNEVVMAEARQKLAAGVDPEADVNAWARAAEVDIMIVGLGSAAGIAMYAHHFPEASITVVDIDQAVVDLVCDYFPLMRRLQDKQCSDGRPRLRLVVNDARQCVRLPSLRDNNTYDLVVLDAYTAGSTIPPHLMTREFYEEIASILNPGGIVLSNIIGSYGGEKHLVLGGAIRSMMAAGLKRVHNIPVKRYEATMDTKRNGNNIVLAAKAGEGRSSWPWQRAEAFTLFPELEVDAYVSELLYAVIGQDRASAGESLGRVCAGRETLTRDLKKALGIKHPVPGGYYWRTLTDKSLINRSLASLREVSSDQRWDQEGIEGILYVAVDHVQFQRSCMTTSVKRAKGSLHAGESLVGRENATIPDAPLFTDQKPNADMLNR